MEGEEVEQNMCTHITTKLRIKDENVQYSDMNVSNTQEPENAIPDVQRSGLEREILDCKTNNKTQKDEAAEKISTTLLSSTEICYSGSSESEFSDIDYESDCMSSDNSTYSGEIAKSFDTRKKIKPFRPFFDRLRCCSTPETEKWLCPACMGSGAGETTWYEGLKPLLAHSRNYKKRRVWLHRELGAILEQEVNIGVETTRLEKWNGLTENEELTNPLIVWPPMVIIENTKLELNDKEKWTGITNKELLEIFKEYNPVGARNAYGPLGHKGVSLLCFAASPEGYLNAKHLDKHFQCNRRGRDDWSFPDKLIFQPGGARILYGYMAVAEDMNIFNRHQACKQKFKWSLQSYQNVVIQPVRELDDMKRQIMQLKRMLVKQESYYNLLTKQIEVLSRKLKMREPEVCNFHQQSSKDHVEIFHEGGWEF